MQVSQRAVALGLLILLSVGELLISLTYIVQGQIGLAAVNVGVAAVFGTLLFAYWRGWEYARHAIVAITTLLSAIALPSLYGTEMLSLSVLIPPTLALVLVSPVWVIGSAALVMGALILASGGEGVYSDPFTIILAVIIVGGMALSRVITDGALRAAKANATQAEEALAHSEAQARELANKADELAVQNDQQRRLLDLVATLETPAVALADGVLLAPVVGHLDSRRAQALTSRLLSEVAAQRARLVVIDIAGVSTVDTEVAQALLRAVQALRLLGCSVTITGISAAVAATMTTLGINMRGIDTARTPQEALELAVTGKGGRTAPPPNGIHQN